MTNSYTIPTKAIKRDETLIIDFLQKYHIIFNISKIKLFCFGSRKIYIFSFYLQQVKSI